MFMAMAVGRCLASQARYERSDGQSMEKSGFIGRTGAAMIPWAVNVVMASSPW